MTTQPEESGPPITSLTKKQRRVLGVLLEKAFTTPDVYPLTLKSATTGCNQKSNRSPLTEYSEDDVQQTLDELRELGVVGVLHTESGRTERFRHYMRQKFQFSEAQLAILTELLLRGRQTMGDLRGRASRMVPINSLEQLRDELNGLLAGGFLQATDDLDRRGVEVDHNWYTPNEGRTLPPVQPAARTAAHVSSAGDGDEDRPQPAPTHAVTAPRPSTSPPQPSTAVLDELRAENDSLRRDLDTLRDEVRELADEVARLKSELGVS